MSTLQLYQLPVDVLVNIVQKLSLKDIRNLMLTCKTLKNLLINDNAFWRPISRRKLIIQHGRNSSSSPSWYDRCRLSHNWCQGIYKHREILYRRSSYMPWLKFHNSECLLLTVGSDLHCHPIDRQGFPNGKNIQWKLSMPKIQRYDKRTDDISRFVLKENFLVCGNRNGSVAIYRVDNMNSQPTLIQYIKDCLHDGQVEVSAVEITNNRHKFYMVTASTGSPVVVFWNCDKSNDWSELSRDGCDLGNWFEMDLGVAGAKCLALNKSGDHLAIGPDGNCEPLLIDVNVAEFVIKSSDPMNAYQIVQDIQWHNESTLCYVTHSGRLEMMDVRTHQVVYKTEDPFQAPFYCVKTDGNNAIIAGVSQYTRCVLFDTRKPHHAQLYFAQAKHWHTSPVYSLDFDSSKLIVAADRGVAALNFNVPASSAERDFSSHLFYK